MLRSLIAGIVATAIGLGVSAQASAEHRHHWRGHHGHHYGWNHNHGHHYGWDRNRDGRIDWRDRRSHYWRDRNHDGRVDWRDRRAPVYYWPTYNYWPR